MKKSSKILGVLVLTLASFIFAGKVRATSFTPQDLVDNYKDYTGFFETFNDLEWDIDYSNKKLRIGFVFYEGGFRIDAAGIGLDYDENSDVLSAQFEEPIGLDDLNEEMYLYNLIGAKLHLDGYTDEEITNFLNSIEDDMNFEDNKYVFSNEFLSIAKNKYSSQDAYYVGEFSLKLNVNSKPTTTTTTTTTTAQTTTITKESEKNPATGDNILSIIIPLIGSIGVLLYSFKKSLKKSN